jgi:hypothetical protein
MLQVGSYKGRISNTGLSEGKNGCLQFEADCHLKEFYQKETKKFVPLEKEEVKHGYFCIITNNGGINERQVDSLKSTLGWDGKDLQFLRNNDFSQIDLKFTLELDDKGELRVNWINSLLYVSRIKDEDLTKFQNILNLGNNNEKESF